MSHKGSRSRVNDRKAYDECPLWNNIEKAKKQPKTKDKREELPIPPLTIVLGDK